MENNSKYEYGTVNLTLNKNTSQGDDKIYIPDGKVIAMGLVVAGDTEGRIIDFGLFDNNNEVIRPADVRFSEKTNGGTFRDSLRPVDFNGGRTFQVRLTSSVQSTTTNVTVQALFMIEKQ